jgi:hypothetical protein
MKFLNRNKFFHRYFPMFLSVLLIVGALGTYLIFNNSTKQVEGAWYNNSWSYRKLVTVDHNKVNTATGTTTPLTNFPVEFSVTDPDLKYQSFGGSVASSTGADILFTSSDGVTALNYEIESYASSTGIIIAWVKVPSLSSTSDTQFYIYFGNANAPANTSGNSQGTWDINYKTVWHFPNGTTLTTNDSTSNANNGTNNGASVANGKLGGGASLNGSSNYILGSSTLNIPVSTISVWANIQVAPSGVVIVAGFAQGNGSGTYDHDIELNGNSQPIYYIYDGAPKSTSLSTAVGTGTWAYLVGVNDGVNSYMYLNGVLVGSVASVNAYTGYSGANVIAGGSTSGLGYIQEKLDEMRVSNAARTADWIATEYNNQNSPSTFLAYGALSSQAAVTATGHINANNSWYSSSWLYRKQITIDHNKVSGVASSTQSNFPIVFSTTDNDLKFTGSGGKVASSTGADILFTSSDGTTLLNYEIEKYASTTGETIAWVKIPILSSVTDNIIYVYFGNVSAPAETSGNITGTWDSNFKAVYHLPNGTTLNSNDSTTNANNGTSVGAPVAVTGKIDGGIMTGSGNYLTTGHNGFPSGAGSFTIGSWVKYSAYPSNGIYYFIGGFGGQGTGNDVGISVLGSGGVGIADLAGWGFDVINSSTVSLNTWHQIVGTYNGTTLSLYMDGIFLTSANRTMTIDLTDVAHPPTIGTFSGYPSGNEFLGTIDEYRVSTIDRSPDWIATEYNNQNSPSTFYSYSAIQKQTPTSSGSSFGSRGASSLGWYSSSWLYRKQITIDHNKVSGVASSTQSNFPILFSTTDNDLKFTGSGGKVASSTGADILFTSSDGTTLLNYEIEKYASTTGETIAWVKIPILSSVTDNIIYVYFGNASAPAETSGNITGTWDSNYKGVYHMKETTGQHSDSTGSCNSTSVNANVQGSANGKIDGADSYTTADTTHYTATGSCSAQNLGQSAYTFSAWVNGANWNVNNRTIMRISGTFNETVIAVNSSGRLNVVTSGIGAGMTGNTTLANSGWYYITATQTGNGCGCATLKLYINGVLDTSGASGGQSNGTQLNTYLGGDSSQSNVNGTFDEAKISIGLDRTADWIATEYNNQSSPSTFYSYSAVGTNSRQDSSGVKAPAVKARGGVRFR